MFLEPKLRLGCILHSLSSQARSLHLNAWFFVLLNDYVGHLEGNPHLALLQAKLVLAIWWGFSIRKA